MVAGATWVKIWADFFCWKISRFWSVHKILSVVFNFLPSSPSLDCEDSDSERESVWKKSGEKFKRAQGQPHGDEIWDFYEKSWFLVKIPWGLNLARKLISWGLRTLKIHLGPALRAMFKILAEPLAALTSGIVQRWYSILVRCFHAWCSMIFEINNMACRDGS